MAKLIFVLALLSVVISANGFFDPRKMFNLKSDLWDTEKRMSSFENGNDSLVRATITQRVDNFNPANGQTFEQHYVMSDEFFFTDGPIFIFLSDYYFLNGSALTDSMVVELARDLSGYMFSVEYRYSAQSVPVDDLSIPNLEFFNINQIIADLAHFINFIKTSINGTENSPVILIGGGYSGSIAALFRQQHPDLALAAWASSAPMLAVSNFYQFKEYSGVTYRSIGGDECYDNLEAGFREMEEIVANNDTNTLPQIFNLCEDFENENDVSLFFYAVAELYSAIPTFATPASVNAVCNLVGNPNVPSRVHAIAILFSNPENCVSTNYDALIENLRNTDIQGASTRAYNYLSCLQLGWIFHTSDSDDQPFGHLFNIDFFYNICRDGFDDSFNNVTLIENVSRFNTAFGGLQPDVTNVIFTHGSMDPWRSIGIQNSLNDLTPAIVIPNASASNDLNSFRPSDSDELTNVKLEIIEIIRNWIAHYNGVDLTPY